MDGNIALEDNGAVLTTGTISLTTNTFYDVRLVDNGSSLALYWNGSSAAFLTGATSSNFGDGIVMFNREGAGNNSFISAGSITSISGISASAVPEPSTFALLTGLLGLSCAVMKCRFFRT